jgi:23S rRNA (pseudouridine1915-N3)-methyltransferase
MWEIRVVTVGRAKDAGIRDGLERYARMVGGEWKLVLDSVPQSKRPDPPACRKEEGRALRGRVGPGHAAIALDAAGRPLDSAGFTGALQRYKDEGRPVTFLVGGPHGLDAEVMDSCDLRLSLSPMTLPHELAALVLAEQVYRAFAARGRKGYSK